MKCKTNILIAHYTNAGYSQILGSVDTVSHRKSPTINGYYEENICDGDIEICITGDLYSTPFESRIRISWICNSCGKHHTTCNGKDLPDYYNIDEWLNNILKNIE